MEMEIKNTEKKEHSIASVTVELSSEEFNELINGAYKKNRNKIMVPGFRKGKAPRKIIESMYGESVFWEDAIEEAAPKAYMHAVKENSFKVVASPSIRNADVTDEKSLLLTIDCVLYPEVNLKQYKGLKAVRKEVKVDSAEIDMEIDSLRNRNSSLITAERAAKFGDTVIIDFEGSIDGVPFDGGKGENHSLEIGSNSFIPGFEVQLIGASAGDEVDVNVTFPENYNEETLAGKPAVFHCIIHEVKEKLLPDLDDEFAKDVSEFDTLEEFKKSIYDRIYKQKADSVRDEFLDKLLDQITEQMDCDIPEAMLEERTNARIDEFGQRLAQSGISMEMYFSMFKMPPDEFRKNMRDVALKQLSQELALAKVAELEGIEVNDDDKEAQYAKMAAQYGVDVDTVKKFFDAEVLDDSIKVVKAADFIIDNAIALAEPEEESASEPGVNVEPAQTDAQEAVKTEE